jgi:hypothetical protein
MLNAHNGRLVVMRQKVLQIICMYFVIYNITLQSYPQLVLTYLGNRFGDDESYNENRPEGLLPGARVYMLVAEPLSKKDAACQR